MPKTPKGCLALAEFNCWHLGRQFASSDTGELTPSSELKRQHNKNSGFSLALLPGRFINQIGHRRIERLSGPKTHC